MRNFTAATVIFLLLVGIIGVLTYQKVTFDQSESISVTSHPKMSFSYSAKSYQSEAIIGGIGDILIHDWVYDDAKTKNGYNFNPMFQPVHSLLQKPDFLIANQESVPGGSELGISSYPLFNSPYEIVDAIINAGVDMVTTANNHMLDKGEEGLLNAINYYENKQLYHTGTFKSMEDKKEIKIIPVNGIKIAVLAYSYGTNGMPIPDGKDYLVNMLEPERVIQDIKSAKKQADLVLLAIHWGDEYFRKPNEQQVKMAHQFIHAGADIILGHHPHVLQPIEWINKPNGSKGLVVYSLGNFLSGQISDYKDVGGMVEITVCKEVKNGNTITSIKNVDFHPTFSSSKHFRSYRIYPLDEANKKGLTDITSQKMNEFMFNE